MVDSAADYFRAVAACLLAFSAAILPAVLGHGLSVRHVHRLHMAAGASPRFAIPVDYSPCFYLYRAGGMAGDVLRLPATAADLSAPILTTTQNCGIVFNKSIEYLSDYGSSN